MPPAAWGKPGAEGKSIYQVLIDELDPAQAIVESCCPGLFLLPASIELAGAEIELVGLPGRESMLKKALAG